MHEQVAITFQVPRYKTLDIKEPVTVNIQLVKISTEETSQPRPFQYVPLDRMWQRRRGERKNFDILSILAGEQRRDSGIKLVGEWCNFPCSSPASSSSSTDDDVEKRSPKRCRNDSGISDVEQVSPRKIMSVNNNDRNLLDLNAFESGLDKLDSLSSFSFPFLQKYVADGDIVMQLLQ